MLEKLKNPAPCGGEDSSLFHNEIALKPLHIPKRYTAVSDSSQGKYEDDYPSKGKGKDGKGKKGKSKSKSKCLVADVISENVDPIKPTKIESQILFANFGTLTWSPRNSSSKPGSSSKHSLHL